MTTVNRDFFNGEYSAFLQVFACAAKKMTVRQTLEKLSHLSVDQVCSYFRIHCILRKWRNAPGSDIFTRQPDLANVEFLCTEGALAVIDHLLPVMQARAWLSQIGLEVSPQIVADYLGAPAQLIELVFACIGEAIEADDERWRRMI